MSKSKYDSQRLHYQLTSPLIMAKRVFRSIKMWGFGRTYAKLINRLGLPIPASIYFLPKKKDFLLVGCGQFGLTTVSYFIARNLGNRFLGCFDINKSQANYAKKTYGYKYVTSSFKELIELEHAKHILIASNHSSHTPQAIQALNNGLKVHVEKPISVSWKQLSELSVAVEGREENFYVGYNRPFAKAIHILRESLKNQEGPFTIQYFIAGHLISGDHWYFDPNEGTRICGNLGHWIDLTVHLLSQGELSDNWEMNLMCADKEMRDQNFSLSMKSEKGDLINFIFTARGEPFDGVSETISIQQGSLMAKIEDFKSLMIWENEKHRKYKFWPKDVGHKKSILQMFDKNPKYSRPWSEVYFSTVLMLHITDMVRDDIITSNFSFSKAIEKTENKQ